MVTNLCKKFRCSVDTNMTKLFPDNCEYINAINNLILNVLVSSKF